MVSFWAFARLAPGVGVTGLAGDVNLSIWHNPGGSDCLNASATMSVSQARELAGKLVEAADEAERGKPLTEGSAP